MIIYIDMDDTVCNFMKAVKERREFKSLQPLEFKFPQSKVGFFENLEAIPGAIESVNFLREMDDVDVYILTAPSVRNPHCYTEKRIWIEKHFDLEFCKKLIICANKGLLKGDFLIDDYISGKGQENFEGKLIHFGSEKFPDWKSVIKFMNTKDQDKPIEFDNIFDSVTDHKAEAENLKNESDKLVENQEDLEDRELNKIADSRHDQKEIKVSIDNL